MTTEISNAKEVANPKKVRTGQSPATKEKLQALMKEESKMVKGIFQCFETPGATTKICVHKYPTRDKGGIDPFEKIMTDGETYEVPLYVARFLNGVDVTCGALAESGSRNVNIGTCSYPVHGFKWKGDSPPSSVQDPMGVPVPMVGISKRVKRYGFQSLEFTGEWAV